LVGVGLDVVVVVLVVVFPIVGVVVDRFLEIVVVAGLVDLVSGQGLVLIWLVGLGGRGRHRLLRARGSGVGAGGRLALAPALAAPALGEVAQQLTGQGGGL